MTDDFERRMNEIEELNPQTLDERLQAEFAIFGDDAAPSWDWVPLHMDNEIREDLNCKMAPCTQREFWEAYCKRDPELAAAQYSEF